MARPKISAQIRLSHVVTFAVTQQDYVVLCEQAEESRQTLSAYVRQKLLDAAFDERFDRMFGTTSGDRS